MNDTSVAIVEPLQPPTLFGSNKPAEVIANATAQANALADVIRQKSLFKAISGRNHVLVEGWTLLGTMLGVFPICEWTRPIEDGWEARVEARTLNGQLVGAAEAQCTRKENTWRTRDDYALRSMAQTRATSKALRLPLGFVMVLAGFEATPAEEMSEESTPQRPVQPAQRPSAPLPSSAAAMLGFDPEELKRLVKEAGLTNADLVPITGAGGNGGPRPMVWLEANPGKTMADLVKVAVDTRLQVMSDALAGATA